MSMSAIKEGFHRAFMILALVFIFVGFVTIIALSGSEVWAQPVKVIGGGAQAQIITPSKPAILHLIDLNGRDHYIPAGMVRGVQSTFQEDGQGYCRIIVEGPGWTPVISVRADAERVAKIWAGLTGQVVHPESIGDNSPLPGVNR